MDTFKATLEAKGLTIADLTTKEQRGILYTKGFPMTGHFAIVETSFIGTWITRRKIGSPKTQTILPVENLVYYFVADATASYEG